MGSQKRTARAEAIIQKKVTIELMKYGSPLHPFSERRYLGGVAKWLCAEWYMIDPKLNVWRIYELSTTDGGGLEEHVYTCRKEREIA